MRKERRSEGPNKGEMGGLEFMNFFRKGDPMPSQIRVRELFILLKGRNGMEIRS